MTVDTFLQALEHPLKDGILRARALLLEVSPEIGEGIKWNAPSFHTADYFATVNLRSTDRVQFIFHTGAKKKNEKKKPAIADPGRLVKWLAPDRCLVTLTDVEGDREAFQAIVRAWIEQV
jgi:hypothetical protein